MSYDDSSQGSATPPPATPAAENPTTASADDSASPAAATPTTESGSPTGDPAPSADRTLPPYPHQHTQPHPYPPHPYGYPPYGYLPPKPPTSGLAVASMVVSITGLVTCLIILNPIGLVMGYKARRKITDQYESGAEFAKLGIILGWIGTGLCALILIPFLVQLILWLT